MTIAPGEKFGDYVVLETIETPRFGLAYKVRNERAKWRIEHLRVLDEEKRGDEDTERFLREIRVHSSLSHPNLIRFYDAARVDGRLVLTTEFVEGITLAQKLAEERLQLPVAVGYARQFLHALEAAHNENIVHREVAPVHILITRDGTVKLGGFGLAKNQNDAALTRAGTVMGWLEYIAPEQVQGMAWVDPRADVYSAGCVLYEMVTGQPPFIGESQFELMMAHVKEQPRPPMEINPAISPELNQVILRALSKGRYERFSTAAQFVEALDTTPEGLAAKAESAGGPIEWEEGTVAAETAAVEAPPVPPAPAEPEPKISLPEPASVRALKVENPQEAVRQSEPLWQVVAAGIVTFAVIVALVWWISLPKG
jgi:serine/threonine protein kinase